MTCATVTQPVADPVGRACAAGLSAMTGGETTALNKGIDGDGGRV